MEPSALSNNSGKETSLGGFKKVLGRFDMVLFILSAILTLDALMLTAAIGPSSISWWLIALFLFFVPYALMTTELATTYPQQGGLFIWVKRAFGGKWAARTTWLYWINVALWVPSVYILFSDIVSQLFAPEMQTWARVGIGIIMTWVTISLGIISTSYGKWIPNIGALLKVVMVIVVGILGLVYATKSGTPNDLSLPNFVPQLKEGINFLPVVAFNFMGFELLASAAGEMRNPKKDIPKAILISGVLIAIFYLCGTLSILMIFRVEDLEAVKSIMDAYWVVFGESGLGGIVVAILGIMTLITIMANMVCWTMGANRTIARAAQEGEFPAIFARLHPTNRTPAGASIIIGLVATLVILIYGFLAGGREGVFRLLFAFSSIVYLLPYLVVFLAFWKLRKMDVDLDRPYRVPLNPALTTLMVVICELFILQAIVFFLWQPDKAFEWSFVGPALLGVVLVFIAGEIVLEIAALKKHPSTFK